MKIKTDNEPAMPSFEIPGIIPDIPDIPAIEAEEVAVPDISQEPEQAEQAEAEPAPEVEEKAEEAEEKPKKKKTTKKNKDKAEEKVEEVAEEDTTPIAIPFTDITEKKLTQLKEEHKKIFRTIFADSTFIWHRLNRQDFNKIAAEARDIEDREERFSTRERSIIRATVVFPHKEELEHFLQEEDILTTSLSEEILYHSGFIPPQTDQL